MTTWRADATNKKCWQKCKVHVCEVEAAYMSKLGTDGKVESRKTLADLLVQEVGTALAVKALVEKHLASVGAHSWKRANESLRRHSDSHNDDPLFPPNHWFTTCSDAGSDQAAARRMIAAEVHASHTNILFVDMDCLIHQYHLSVQYQLKPMNNCLRILGCKSENDFSSQWRQQ